MSDWSVNSSCMSKHIITKTSFVGVSHCHFFFFWEVNVQDWVLAHISSFSDALLRQECCKHAVRHSHTVASFQFWLLQLPGWQEGFVLWIRFNARGCITQSKAALCNCLTQCVNYFLPFFNTKIRANSSVRADADVTAESQPVGKDIPAPFKQTRADMIHNTGPRSPRAVP